MRSIAAPAPSGPQGLRGRGHLERSRAHRLTAGRVGWQTALVALAVVLTAIGVAVMLLPLDSSGSPAIAGSSPTIAGSPASGPGGAPADAAGAGGNDASSDAGTNPGPPRGAGWIAAENAKPGTRDWLVSQDPKTWDAVRGYASTTSVDAGGSFGLYVTSGSTWHVEAYRMGYYGGAGGRLVWRSGDQPPSIQPAAVTDPKTLMREAHWAKSLDVTADGAWPPGMYLLKLVAPAGATYVPMVVRDDESTAALLVQSSVTTWQAYNSWGGATLYAGPGNNGATRSRVVSFDRPYDGTGSGEFFGREREFVYFVERLGLDVTYWTDIDLHQQPQRVRQHKGFVSLGHDEYYSTSMRDGLEQARDAGVNLAFFGANAIFRKIRLEPSPLGDARREVNYRDAKEDPLAGKQPDQVTVSWRDAPSNDPESALLGNFYECNPVKADMVVTDAGSWIWAGTGLRDGDKLPDMVANEYDRVTPERPTPANIQVLSHSPLTCKGKKSHANSTYYTAPSGAGVYDAGTFMLIRTLDDDACITAPNAGPRCQVQTMVGNILTAFAAGPAGVDHPSVSNLDKVGIPRPKASTGPPTTTVSDPDED